MLDDIRNTLFKALFILLILKILAILIFRGLMIDVSEKITRIKDEKK
jgi:hypothetical protein